LEEGGLAGIWADSAAIAAPRAGLVSAEFQIFEALKGQSPSKSNRPQRAIAHDHGGPDAFAEQRERIAENVAGHLEMGIDGNIVNLPEEGDRRVDIAEFALFLCGLLD
jgi:hypothetical protein